jgi:hypothetical protein
MHFGLGTRGLSLLAASAFLLFTRGDCSYAQQVPTSVAAAQRRLLALAVPDQLDTNVPANIQVAIGNLKQSLALQTDAMIARLPSNATALMAKQQLSASLPPTSEGKVSDAQWRQREAAKPGQPDSGRNADLALGLYGGELTIVTSQPTPSLLLVQETFDIACGSDTVLLVYSNASGTWKRSLLWQSKPYTEISGAFGDIYETLLLKPDYQGNPLLLVLHGTPWCTSTMSRFDMDAFELGAATGGKPMWHGTHEYRRADLDPPLSLRATTNGFEVRTSVSANGRGDRIARRGVMRYAVGSDGIHRVEPIAMNAADSLDEWFEMPRTEAVAFADGPATSMTWTMFDDFTSLDKSKGANVPYPSIGAVRACKGDGDLFQAEVTSQIFGASGSEQQSGPAFFVQLQQVSDGYRIHAVTRTPDSTCTGPDLMGAR